MILSIIIVIIFGADKMLSNIQVNKCNSTANPCYCEDSCSRNISKDSQQLCSNSYCIIDKCNNNNIMTKDIRTKCEDNIDFNVTQLVYNVPVYTKENNNFQAYKNLFCAICNGKKQFTFADLIEKKVHSNFSKFYIKLPIQFRKICYETLKNKCNEYYNDNMIIMLCNSENNLYFAKNGKIDQTIYRKRFCSQYKGNLSLVFDCPAYGVPIEIGAIDFNKWCLSDCQQLLEEFHINQSRIENNTTKIHQTNVVILEIIIPTILRILSIISLLFMLFVYVCVINKNNRARKITICLSSSILVSSIVNTVISFQEYYTLSTSFTIISAILFHYCFLSSFAWMSIFAVDVYQSLTSSCVVNKNYSNIFKSRKFKIYFVIGFIIPLVFTLTSFIIQLIDKNNVLSAGFGERQMFISRLIGGLVWCFIPLCACLIINILVCVGLFRFIYLVNQQTVMVRNIIKDRKENFQLCMKLSILFGAVWLFGFLGIFFDNYVLKIVGSVFSSLQGFLVSFCFVCGGNIRRKTSQYIRTMSNNISKNIMRTSSKSEIGMEI